MGVKKVLTGCRPNIAKTCAITIIRKPRYPYLGNGRTRGPRRTSQARNSATQTNIVLPRRRSKQTIIRGMEMIAIPEGWFWMGSSGAGQESERPRHRVWVDAFRLARYQVTNAEYAKFLAEARCAPSKYWGQ